MSIANAPDARSLTDKVGWKASSPNSSGPWSNARSRFLQVCRCHPEDWQRIRRDLPAPVRCAGEPGGLLEFMHNTGGDLDEKDDVLVALISLRSEVGSRETAAALLWLSLWPALDAVYRTHLRFFRSDPNELAGELFAAFTETVNAFRPSRVRRVAATLVRNTQRRLRDRIFVRREAGCSTRRRTRATREAVALAEFEHEPVNRPPMPGVGFANYGEVHAGVRQLFAQLGPVDGPLLFGQMIEGKTSTELARQHGMSRDAVRKRLSRLVARVETDGLGAHVGPLVNREKRNRQPRCHISTAGGAFTSQRASKARRRK